MSQIERSEFKVDARPATVRKQAEAQLRRAIVEGHFLPGEHLSDRSLQKIFQVSRTVVREAVRQLEAEGLVETIPHRGSFVKVLSPAEAEQVYAVREVLEELAAREFTRNASDAQIDALEAALKEISSQPPTAEGRELIASKQKFYDILLDGCANRYVAKMLGQILNQNTQLRATTMSVPARLPEMIRELEKIVQAARKRDPDAAGKAIVEHVRNAARAALPILKQRSASRTGESGT